MGSSFGIHLRKQKSSCFMSRNLLALMRATGVQAPVPQRKNQNVCYPKRHGGAEQDLRLYLVFRNGYDQKSEGPDQCEGQDSTCRVPERLVGPVMANSMRDQCGENQRSHDC